MENGIETGNILRYNLGIFVKPSSTTLNVDITPGTYWVTNANNTVSHNAAAGGSHFGFWYQMFEHPDGPSFTKTVCPRYDFNQCSAYGKGFSKFLCLTHKIYPIDHHSSLEHAIYGTSCLLLAFLDLTTCHLSNLRSMKLISSLSPLSLSLSSFFHC